MILSPGAIQIRILRGCFPEEPIEEVAGPMKAIREKWAETRKVIIDGREEKLVRTLRHPK